jgi:hypothetical protein
MFCISNMQKSAMQLCVKLCGFTVNTTKSGLVQSEYLFFGSPVKFIFKQTAFKCGVKKRNPTGSS